MGIYRSRKGRRFLRRNQSRWKLREAWHWGELQQKMWTDKREVQGELRPKGNCLTKEINVTHKTTHLWEWVKDGRGGNWGGDDWEGCLEGRKLSLVCAEIPRQREGLQDPGIYGGDGLLMSSVCIRVHSQVITCVYVTFVSSGKLSPAVVSDHLYTYAFGTPSIFFFFKITVLRFLKGVVLFLPLETCGKVVPISKEIKCSTGRDWCVEVILKWWQVVLKVWKCGRFMCHLWLSWLHGG